MIFLKVVSSRDKTPPKIEGISSGAIARNSCISVSRNHSKALVMEQPKANENGWISFPTKVCNFFRKGTCLRFECQYFHGTEVQMRTLMERGAELYRINDGRIYFADTNTSSCASSIAPRSQEEEQSRTSLPVSPQHIKKTETYQRKKVVACLNYLGGKCNQEDCRFVHLRPEIRLLPPGVCAFHSSPQGCVKSTECRYFHGTKEELEEMRDRGIVAYNPFTNEPYKKLPLELEHKRRQFQRTSPARSFPDTAVLPESDAQAMMQHHVQPTFPISTGGETPFGLQSHELSSQVLFPSPSLVLMTPPRQDVSVLMPSVLPHQHYQQQQQQQPQQAHQIQPQWQQQHHNHSYQSHSAPYNIAPLCHQVFVPGATMTVAPQQLQNIQSVPFFPPTNMH